MATDIVGSLFGVTPEMYQQRQAQIADEQALQYAKLDPFQQANFAIGRGAYGLAGALGGALGAQDPQLQLISQRNAIAKQIDYNDPASIMQGVRSLSQYGDTVGAMQLADVARKLQSEMAQTFQRTAAGQASLGQLAKTQAEIDETKRQQLAFAALIGKAPASAAPAEAMPTADVAPVALGPRTETLLDRAGEPYTVDIGGAIPAPIGVMENIPPSGTMPTPTATPAAAPATPPQTRATLSQQIAALEDRRKQFLALTKIPDAKAEAEILSDRIKDLRSQLKPTELTNLDREIEQLRAEGVADTDPRIKTRLDKINKLSSGGVERFGSDREAISMEVYDKPFAQLTPTQRAVVNKRVEDEQGKRAQAGAPKPGERVEPKDWLKFEEFVEKQPTFKRTASIVSAAPSVLRTIRQSTSNDFAARALPSSIARLFDEGVLSNNDVKNYAVTGGLDDRLATMASNFFTGTVTSVTKQQAEQFMTSVYRGALIDQRNTYVKQAQRLGYADSPNYLTTIKQIDEELAKFKLVTPPKTPDATGTVTPAASARTTGNPLVDKYLNPQSPQR